MKILYHIQYPKALGADRWIADGWRDAFIDLGHEFYELTASDSLATKLTEIKPDIFMTAINILNPKSDLPVIQQARKNNTKLFMWSHWPLEPGLEMWEPVLRTADVADIYFGEREPEAMGNFEQVVGRPYHLIPNAANKKLHFPTAPVRKYDYDIVFLGANLQKKQQLFQNILKPLSAKYRVGLFGPGWTLKDKILKILQRCMRMLGMTNVSNFINQLRITVPVGEERELYSSAKIALNFHEREPDGSQPHYILNQRTFKIPACGGFEICDYVPALRKYFKEDELVMARMDPEDWFSKIEYYLTHDTERNEIKERGTTRALRDHTYHNRALQVLELYHNTI